MQHLVEWTWLLHGRSGSGFGAVNLLSFREVEAFARQLDLDLEPFEVRALIDLDSAILAGQSSDDDDRADEPESENAPAAPAEPDWPTRKAPPRFLDD